MEQLAELGDLDRDVAREQFGLGGERRGLALVVVHRARRGVGDGARRGQPVRHAAQVVLRQPNSMIGRPNWPRSAT